MVLMPLAHPACRLGTVLGCTPMRWIGARSYGIYLWQTPVIVITAANAATPQDEGLFRKLLQLAAIFGIAALSWRYVEEPIRHGAIRPPAGPPPPARLGLADPSPRAAVRC